MTKRRDMAFRDITQLRCPETQQPLEFLDDAARAALNDSIEAGELVYEDGRQVDRPLEDALLREDGRYVYPVRDGVPNLLLADRIEHDTD
ncbi:MAG: Trm112 family protein [Myxococcota bacterium]